MGRLKSQGNDLSSEVTAHESIATVTSVWILLPHPNDLVSRINLYFLCLQVQNTLFLLFSVGKKTFSYVINYFEHTYHIMGIFFTTAMSQSVYPR